VAARKCLLGLLKSALIPDEELLVNLGLYTAQPQAKILYRTRRMIAPRSASDEVDQAGPNLPAAV
jgi:hypothetical protein